MMKRFGWAYTGMAIAGAASIAANVLHAMIPKNPPRGSVFAAGLWPVLLFVAIEILAKVNWPKGRWVIRDRKVDEWLLVRLVGLVPVAVVAGVVSYRHMSGLLAHWGEDPLAATIGPIAVDGLLVMATGALIAAGVARSAPERAQEPAGAPEPTEEESGPAPDPSEAPMPRQTRRRMRGSKAQATDEDLEQVVRPLVQAGKGRPTIQKALKDAGLTCETTKLANLIATLKDEPLTVS
jgi:hypothetical protein